MRLPNNVKIINAEGKKFQVILTEVKSLLLGKCKPTYIANTDGGDYVIIINSKKIIFNHQKYNSYFGLIKYQKVKYIIENDTEKLYRLALRNLLPKTSLGRRILKKLKVYKEDIEDIDDLKKFILNAEINKTQELSLKRKSCP
ncbi:MAG: uL13 family ribosomal protein [Campylobacterota bacterium]|nr:uL13 family ribosomal protein [Campylobacterota bacterium]